MMQDLSIIVVTRVPRLDELSQMEIGETSAYHVRRDVCCQLKSWLSEQEPVSINGPSRMAQNGRRKQRVRSVTDRD
jgi:hypothetical protein